MGNPTAEEQPTQRATGWSRRIRLSDATRLAVISSTISAVIGAVATIVVAGMTGNGVPAPPANPPATQVTSQPSPTLPLSPTPFAIPSGPLDPCVIGTWHGVLKNGWGGGFTLTLTADGAGSQRYDQLRYESDKVPTVNIVATENGTSRFKFGTAGDTVAFELKSGDYASTSTVSSGIWPFRQSTTRTDTVDSNLIGSLRYLCTADRLVLTYPHTQVEYHR